MSALETLKLISGNKEAVVAFCSTLAYREIKVLCRSHELEATLCNNHHLWEMLLERDFGLSPIADKCSHPMAAARASIAESFGLIRPINVTNAEFGEVMPMASARAYAKTLFDLYGRLFSSVSADKDTMAPSDHTVGRNVQLRWLGYDNGMVLAFNNTGVTFISIVHYLYGSHAVPVIPVENKHAIARLPLAVDHYIDIRNGSVAMAPPLRMLVYPNGIAVSSVNGTPLYARDSLVFVDTYYAVEGNVAIETYDGRVYTVDVDVGDDGVFVRASVALFGETVYILLMKRRIRPATASDTARANYYLPVLFAATLGNEPRIVAERIEIDTSESEPQFEMFYSKQYPKTEIGVSVDGKTLTIAYGAERGFGIGANLTHSLCGVQQISLSTTTPPTVLPIKDIALELGRDGAMSIVDKAVLCHANTTSSAMYIVTPSDVTTIRNPHVINYFKTVPRERYRRIVITNDVSSVFSNVRLETPHWT